MADIYSQQQVGVADGTQTPSLKSDSREVDGKGRITLASKVTGTAWNIGDRVYLGKKPAGAKITDIKLCTGTSLGTATLDIGDGTTADKYAAAKTLTVVDTPTSIGPKASTMDDAPGAEEDLWATVGVAAIAAGTALTFAIEMVGLN